MNISPPIKRIGLISICAIILVLIGSLFAAKYEPINRGDPDRYYHFAISAITAHEFAPETIPQVEDLGWGKIFYEKEFAFHVLTGWGYRFGQERGVVLTTLSLGLVVLLLMFLICCRRTSPAAALLTTLCLGVSCERFVIRMFTVRPHVLAVAISLGLFWAILARRPRLVALACVCFALSYHAVYIPLLFCILGVVAALVVSRNWRSEIAIGSYRAFVAACIGLAIGIVINPYFPTNVMMGLQHLKIALSSTGLPLSHFGNELRPFTGIMLLQQLPGFYLIVALGLILMGVMLRPVAASLEETRQIHRYEVFTAFLSVLLFLAVSMINPRGIEFLVPLSAIFLSHAVGFLPRPKTILAVLALAVFSAQVLGNAKGFRDLGPNPEFLKQNESTENKKYALQRIPIDPQKSKLANCSWDISPVIFYARPDLRFIDILDPSFLHSRDPELYNARESWVDGDVPDSYRLLKSGFHADYVMCDQPNVRTILESDPNFSIVFPRTIEERSKTKIFIYALAPQRRPEFINSMTFSARPLYVPMSELSKQHTTESITSDLVQWNTQVEDSGVRPVFIDLFRELKIVRKADATKEKDGDINIVKEVPVATDDTLICTDVYPESPELQRLEGATIVGLGGGPFLELYVDGVPKYTTVRASGSPTMVHTLIDLEKPILSTTKIKVRVCGFERSPFLGTAVSLWKPAAIDGICQQRTTAKIGLIPALTESLHPVKDLECFAAFARKNFP